MKIPDWLPESEFSPEFVRAMMNRMAVSFHKYGKVADAAGRVDFLASLRVRLDKYLSTGNTEWLVDVGNLAMMEFMHPSHPEAHFRGTDSAESPGRVTTTGRTTFKTNEDIPDAEA